MPPLPVDSVPVAQDSPCYEFRAGRISDPLAGPVQISAGVCVDYVCVEADAAVPNPGAGHYSLFVDDAGLWHTKTSGGVVATLLTADLAEDLYEPLGTAADVMAAHLADPDPHEQYALKGVAPGGIAYWVDGDTVDGSNATTLNEAGEATFAEVYAEEGFGAGGREGATFQQLPWPDVEGGLIVEPATWPALDFDEEGTAVDLMAAHLAAADPHPQYLTPAEGAAAYDPLGEAADEVAAHEAEADPHPQYALDTRIDALTFADLLGGLSSAQLPGGDWVTSQAAESQLNASWNIVSANGVFEATGLTLSLPGAGRYLLWVTVRGRVTFSAGTSGAIQAKLRRTSGTPGDVAGSFLTPFSWFTANVSHAASSTRVTVYDAAGADTLELHVCRLSATAWTTSSVLGYDGTTSIGTSIGYMRLDA